MLKDGVYQITNVHTKQALYIGADAENGSELKTRDRITSWSEFRVESQGGRAYTLVADHNGMSARISDKKNVPVASRSSFKFHLIAISTPLKQYRISDVPEGKFIVVKKGSTGKYKVALASRRTANDRQYWKFSYQRALSNKGKGKGTGGGTKDGGKAKEGRGKKDGGGDAITKPEPTPKPQLDPATQQLVNANNQLLQQIAQSNAWQQQMISALVGRLVGGPGLGGPGGGRGTITGGSGYTPRGGSPVQTPPDSPTSDYGGLGEDDDDDDGIPVPNPKPSGGGRKVPKPKPKKKIDGGGKTPAGAKKKAGAKGKGKKATGKGKKKSTE